MYNKIFGFGKLFLSKQLTKKTFNIVKVLKKTKQDGENKIKNI